MFLVKTANKGTSLISIYVQNISQKCISDSTGTLSGPLTYEEVASVFSNLKSGVSSVLLDSEHIRYAGPSLWRLLFHMYGGGVLWLTNTDGELCLLCKESVEDVSHFLLDCPNFRDNRGSLWSNLSQKVIACNHLTGPKYHIFQ